MSESHVGQALLALDSYHPVTLQEGVTLTQLSFEVEPRVEESRQERIPDGSLNDGWVNLGERMGFPDVTILENRRQANGGWAA